MYVLDHFAPDPCPLCLFCPFLLLQGADVDPLAAAAARWRIRRLEEGLGHGDRRQRVPHELVVHLEGNEGVLQRQKFQLR